mmetsp:Transcript_3957/g.7996  ORF Transcript_3957/g.7996 Transcript_3957/m.7996 type:complete len:215 (+) Transcript_3957:344-988(+)
MDHVLLGEASHLAKGLQRHFHARSGLALLGLQLRSLEGLLVALLGLPIVRVVVLLTHAAVAAIVHGILVLLLSPVVGLGALRVPAAAAGGRRLVLPVPRIHEARVHQAQEDPHGHPLYVGEVNLARLPLLHRLLEHRGKGIARGRQHHLVGALAAIGEDKRDILETLGVEKVLVHIDHALDSPVCLVHHRLQLLRYALPLIVFGKVHSAAPTVH